MPAGDEGAIIARARAGDRDAVGDLFVLHSPSVRRLLRSVLGPGEDLDDLTQEVFVRVHRSVARYRGDSAFSTWLHRLTVNTALSHLRTLGRRHLPTDPASIALDMKDEAPDTHDLAVGREMVRRLYAILDTISPKRRAAFTLFEIEGRDLAQLAELMGISKAAAKSRVWFARREVIKKAGNDPYLGTFLEELER